MIGMNGVNVGKEGRRIGGRYLLRGLLEKGMIVMSVGLLCVKL